MELNAQIEQLQPEMVAALKTLVNIKSVEDAPAPGAPFGKGAAACLDAALALCKKLGFRTHNMDGYVGWAEYGEGDEMVALLGHLDVVPEGDGWTVCKPYEATEKEGRLYGRGTIDDKGPVIAALFGLKALADTGFAPKKRIRILFGCNEETGSADMEYYCAHGGEIPVTGFTPDGEYPLINGEKGIANVTFEKALAQQGDWKLLCLEGGTAPNIVPAHAVAELSCPEDVSLLASLTYPDFIHVTPTAAGLHIEAEGLSAHGSVPEKGHNAIGRLCQFLAQLPLSPDAASAIAFIADNIGTDTTGKAFGIDLKDDLSGGLSFNLGMARSTEGKQLAGKRAGDAPVYQGATALRFTINYRWPVTFHYEDCGPKLNAAFAKAGWKVAQEGHEDALYQPADSALVQKLLAVYKAETGDASPAKCIGGGTYAKAIPNILAFGPVFPGTVAREHEPDEYIELSHLVLNAKIYAAAIRALAE
ncbi:MAG: dipeptidase PepV [Faecalibacterium sp.]|jgi:succinyl-diaminopimelate desuccinylase|nr:dipeptidase PepV [Faecalibacterium sp.]